MAASRRLAALVAAILPFALAPAAHAQTVLTGSGAMTPTYQFLNASGSPTGNTMTTANAYDLSVPGDYTLSDTFTSQQTSLQYLVGTSGSGASGNVAFQDTYQMTITAAASGDALIASLSCCGSGSSGTFDISNLQFRLYEVAAGTAPTVGALPANATAVTNWTAVASGSSNWAMFSNLAAGEYFLDVVGTADGSLGGSYVGTVQMVAPVPLPAALPLLLGGLGLLGGLARRRSA